MAQCRSLRKRSAIRRLDSMLTDAFQFRTPSPVFDIVTGVLADAPPGAPPEFTFWADNPRVRKVTFRISVVLGVGYVEIPVHVGGDALGVVMVAAMAGPPSPLKSLKDGRHVRIYQTAGC